MEQKSISTWSYFWGNRVLPLARSSSWNALLLPPRNSLQRICQLLRIQTRGLRSPTSVRKAGEPQLSREAAALRAAGHLLFILPGSHSERYKRRRFQALAGEASRNSSCSLAGSCPSWRNEEQFQMHVRKQRANVRSFAGGGVVGKARSGCFAAEINVLWMCKTPFPKGAKVFGGGGRAL